MINLDWDKVNGLMPAIIQDHETLEVLMLGYMNEEALKISQSSGFATFYSRTKQRLWTKGETSGNKLTIHKIIHDCDKDMLNISNNSSIKKHKSLEKTNKCSLTKKINIKITKK